jgi:hypothetical protein
VKRERERVCVCEREREREREIASEGERVRERARESYVRLWLVQAEAALIAWQLRRTARTLQNNMR